SQVFENQSAFQGVRRCLPRSGGLQSAASGWADWRPPFLEICNKLRHGVGLNVFAQILIDHAYGRRAATGEAFNELDAVISIGADRNGIVHSLTVSFAINSSRRA